MTPIQSWDFSQAHLFSDLDVTRTDLTLSGRWQFGGPWWLDARARFAEYEDDAPYLYDTSGQLDDLSLAVGRRF